MKKYFALAIMTTVLLSCGTRTTTNDLAISNPIATSIDLVNVVDDKVSVTIDPGRFTEETVTYRLPRVVQGTYSVSDFGRFVDDFKAFDYEGNELNFNKTDTNTWVIENAVKLNKITYYTNDTYDLENGEEEMPFSPSGTNIEPENFVLNLHGFIGYFDSLKNNQYTLDITSPSGFKRSSALQQTAVRESEDGNSVVTSYYAPRYFDITDNPMMFGNLSVEEFNVGNIKIVVSVYSPNNVHSASTLKETVYKMMQGQKAYLGVLDSTPRYDIFLYLADMQKEDAPQGFGALEHHTSTVVVLPEQSTKEELDESIIDVVAHEFFHIVTPLSVHSEDVHYFDYNQPTFSKHLWMYEGVTEYFAQHFQVYEGLVSEQKFYSTVMQKINVSKRMDDTMSFTEMSENILEEPYASNYYNVYQKGALIGMCIDILMREASNGQRSMLSLMKELSNKYGKNKPFNDDAIIDEITEMTYPSVGEFLKTHVEGKTPINYESMLDKVGLVMTEGKVETNYIMNGGALILSATMDGNVVFSELVKNNSFWSDQGVQPNDVIKEVDGQEVTLQNANQIFAQVYTWKPGREIEMLLSRNGEDIEIKTVLEQSYTMAKIIQEKDGATEDQKTLRIAWLNSKTED